MTFGSELKPNEFGAINGYLERQLEVYGSLQKVLADKAAADKEYGRKIVDMARAFKEQLNGAHDAKEGSGMNSLTLTDAEAADTKPLELLPAVNEWAVRLEGEGILRVQLANKAASEVSEEMQRAIDSLGEARKKSLDFHQKLLAERDRIYEQKDKARSQYDTKSKALNASQQRQERATTEKDQDKYRQKADKDASVRNQAKNEYILQVAVANSVKSAVNQCFTPRIMDTMQAINEQRVSSTKRLLIQLLSMQEAADKKLAAGTMRAGGVVSRVDPQVDSCQYIRHRVDSGLSKWEEPADFRVVVDYAAGENDAMALDGESQVILRNLCLQAQKDRDRADQEMQEKSLAAQSHRQKAQAGGKGSEKEMELAAESEREATLAELECAQHQAINTAVEKQLGSVDRGSPHEFKVHTVAISKTCDYCSESIGGLNRKAAKCTLCDYTCHAKCQIKVEPNCPGPDPEAKGGFLSMFGTKRGRKKSKSIHQRSESVVSGNSSRVSTDTHSNSAVGLSSASDTRQVPLPPRNQTLPAPVVVSSENTSYASIPQPAAATPQRMPLPPDIASRALPSAETTVNNNNISRKPACCDATVLYDFEGDGATTLTVQAGDSVRVVEPDDDGSGWTGVELGSTGKQGMVPTLYVEKIEREKSGEYVVALYEFSGRDTDELSFSEGDKIRVVDRDIGDGWMLGSLNGKEGRLPANYVQG